MRQTTCGHPKKRHYAFGLCGSCYHKHKKATDADYLRRQRQASMRWYYRNFSRSAADNRRHKLRAYGLTPEAYDALLAQQGGRCAICHDVSRVENQWGPTRLAVDHSHMTIKVRGLLCSHCNRGLGYFKETPGLLLRAMKYLQGTTLALGASN